MKSLRIGLVLAFLLVMGFTLPAFGQSTPQQVKGTGWVAKTESSPAVAGGVTNGKAWRYIAWRGTNDLIYFAMNNGEGWTDHQIVGGTNWTAETSAAPALQTQLYNSAVWLAWKGKSSNNIYVSSWNGTEWTQQQQVQGTGWTAGTKVGPAVGATSGAPYVAWKGASDGRIWYTVGNSTKNGLEWSTQQVVEGSGWTAETSATPSFAVDSSGGQYLFWKGESGDSIWYSDGAVNGGALDFGQQNTTKCEASTDEGPATAAFDSDGSEFPIAIFWKSSSSNAILYDAFYNSDPCGSTVANAATNVAPAVASYIDAPSAASILAWKNATDNTVWFLDPTTLPGLTDF